MGYKGNIIISLITRFLGAFITLGISVITARELGTERLGEISLAVLAIAIAMLVSGILSGPPLVYFTSRKRLNHLLVPAYIANVLVSILVCWVLALTELYDPRFLGYVILISILQGFYSTHFYVLLGLEKLMPYNIIGIVQVLVSIISICLLIYVFDIRDADAYFIAQAFSFLIGFIITIPFIKRTKLPTHDTGYRKTMTEIIRYGFVMQIASIFQQLNYRLSYYVIHWQLGDSKLGVFALTMQIAEGVLMVSRSVAVVLFSKTSNLQEKSSIVDKTNNTLKFTYISTIMFMVTLLVIPVGFYEFVFGKDFSETKLVLWFISPGIIFLAIQTILSSYFSSVDKVKVNAIGSFAGLIAIAIIVWPLTMGLDLKGGAIANVISYLVSMLVSIFVYLWVEKNRLGDIIFGPEDVKRYLKVFGRK